MKKVLIHRVLMLLLGATIYTNAFVIEDEGWTAVSVCEKEMNIENMNLENIIEIQTQDGLSWYSGEWNKYSTLKILPIGFGVWVKTNKPGVNFNTGESSEKITIELIRDNDFTLVASCSQRDTSTLDMTKFLEIQDYRGNSIYQEGSEFEPHNNLLELLNGPAYWVKGDVGTLFNVKENLTIPSEFIYQLINNRGETLTTTLDGYTIKFFANYEEVADSQANHTGIIVRVDGKDAPIIHPQGTYRGKEIVVGIYSPTGKLIGITEKTTINSEGIGTIIDINITEEDNLTPIVNHAPIINGTPTTTATVNTPYIFIPTASDSDGDSLTFSIDTKPNWLSFNTTSGKLSGTPTVSDIESSTMTISVSDEEKTASLAPFTLTVSEEVTCTEEVPDTYASFTTAKDNLLTDVSKIFNGLEVRVTTNTVVSVISSGTSAIYGLIDGENTGALLKLNTNYPSDTIFVVKVYKDEKLVGMSDEKLGGTSYLDFSSITTTNCNE